MQQVVSLRCLLELKPTAAVLSAIALPHHLTLLLWHGMTVML
jgi:hypothetical protein